MNENLSEDLISELSCYFIENPICRLFNISFPLIQAGMVWCSGWKLASTVSNAGALGLLGSGSMSPELLRLHIHKAQNVTTKPFGVNVPLLYAHALDNIQVCIEENIKIIFTSAGNPHLVTDLMKKHHIKWVHVVSSVKFAIKAEEAGCDAVVAEGFEAGGHNGREETTTMCLIPMVVNTVKIPVIAAGGIGDGRSMAAAFALGASGVQVGSRFAASLESSAHENFKKAILHAKEGDTDVTLKTLTPVRMIKNKFYRELQNAIQNGASNEDLKKHLGHGRSKKGIFEGDLDEGELEIGQISARIQEILPASTIVQQIILEFLSTAQKFCSFQKG